MWWHAVHPVALKCCHVDVCVVGLHLFARLQVAKEVVLSKYEDYGSIQQEIHVRVVNLPVVDSLRDLRHVHLGVLIKVQPLVATLSPRCHHWLFHLRPVTLHSCTCAHVLQWGITRAC